VNVFKKKKEKKRRMAIQNRCNLTRRKINKIETALPTEQLPSQVVQ